MKKLLVVFCSVLIMTACNCKDNKCNDKAVGDSAKVSCCDSMKARCDSTKGKCDSTKMDSCCKITDKKKCCKK
jgi:hypothetical protein